MINIEKVPIRKDIDEFFEKAERNEQKYFEKKNRTELFYIIAFLIFLLTFCCILFIYLIPFGVRVFLSETHMFFALLVVCVCFIGIIIFTIFSAFERLDEIELFYFVMQKVLKDTISEENLNHVVLGYIIKLTDTRNKGE